MSSNGPVTQSQFQELLKHVQKINTSINKLLKLQAAGEKQSPKRKLRILRRGVRNKSLQRPTPQRPPQSPTARRAKRFKPTSDSANQQNHEKTAINSNDRECHYAIVWTNESGEANGEQEIGYLVSLDTLEKEEKEELLVCQKEHTYYLLTPRFTKSRVSIRADTLCVQVLPPEFDPHNHVTCWTEKVTSNCRILFTTPDRFVLEGGKLENVIEITYMGLLWVNSRDEMEGPRERAILICMENTAVNYTVEVSYAHNARLKGDPKKKRDKQGQYHLSTKWYSGSDKKITAPLSRIQVLPDYINKELTLVEGSGKFYVDLSAHLV